MLGGFLALVAIPPDYEGRVINIHPAFCLKFEETLYPTPQLVEWRPLRPKWKLERGKGYTIRLMAGSRSVEAKALAESKAVTIQLADRAINERLRTADVLEVKGEGATLRVPLDGSTAALARLDSCFDKNSRGGVETKPFVSPGRKP